MSTSTLVSRMFQVKIGIRNIVMPGARMQKIVVMKLTAPRMVPKPASASPMIHRSAPEAGREQLGVQRRVGEPAERRRSVGVRNPSIAMVPPKRNSQ